MLSCLTCTCKHVYISLYENCSEHVRLHGNSWCLCWAHVDIEKAVPRYVMWSVELLYVMNCELIAMCNVIFMREMQLWSTPMGSNS